MLVYFITFSGALLITYLVTPAVEKFAVQVGAVDQPGKRKIHATPIPRLGGLAIWLGFVLSLLAAVIAANLTGMQLHFKSLNGILLGSSLLMLVGVVDDIRGLRATTKLIWQIIAALIVIRFGVSIYYLSNPFNGMIVMGAWAAPLAVIWLVGMTNAMNLIDGLDGLASGVTAIASMALFFVALRTHQMSAALLMLALAGSSLGFLRHNFFPASIFLGDSGSLFLGFILASASIIGVLKTTLVVALVVPVIILGVPIFDTLFAIVRRVSKGKHPFEADDKHIHHMLLRAGFNKREAVLSIYIVCFILSIMALVMALQR